MLIIQKPLNGFAKRLNKGNDDAQYLMGCCYKDGKGVEQNDEEAFRWLRLAARQEHEGHRNYFEKINKFGS